jgi:mannose-6-phosphate isomerase-like protein (cupin superfamily)
MPPGTTEVSHRHARAQQVFYVLAGELVLYCGAVRHVLSARHGLHIPAGVAHQAVNESSQDVEFLVISEPPSHGDREAVSLG